MNKKTLFGLAGSTGAAAALTFLLTIWVVSNESGRVASPIEAGVAASALAQSDGPSEAIDVHGHWIIEIRNPDGSLANRREFDNALQIGGKRWLIRALRSTATFGQPSIYLEGSACVDSEGDGRAIEIWSTIVDEKDLTHSCQFRTLIVEDNLSDPTCTSEGDCQLVYRGSGISNRDGSVHHVQIRTIMCNPTISPADCFESSIIHPWGGGTFTQTQLDAEVSVVPGQQILVTVTVTFGTAPTT